MKKTALCIAIAMLNSFCLFAQTPFYVPASGLVAWYPFKFNANDRSGNGINGTVTNASLTTDRFGNCNSAYYFNGSNAYISASSSSFNSLNHFTISFWLQVDNYPSAGSYMITKGNETSGGSPLSFRCYTGALPFQYLGTDNFISGTPVVRYATTSAFSSNNWHHLTLTYDGSDQIVYIDGTSSTSVSQTGSLRTNTDPLMIGARFFAGNLQDAFEGKLDDIGVWNRALTATEVADLYQGEGDIPNYLPATNLIAWYPFKFNANDKSGNAINGIVNSASLADDRFGNCNSAYYFNGTNAYIAAKSSLLDNLNQFTINYWYQIDAYPLSGSYMITKGDETSGGVPLSFRSYVGGSPFQYVGSDNFTTGTPPTRYATISSFSANDWHNFTMLYDGVSQKAYIDGVLTDSIPQSGTLVTNTDSIRFGARIYAGSLMNAYEGKLDDIAIWDVALTAADIAAIYNASATNTYTKKGYTGIVGTQTLQKYATLYPNPASKTITIETEQNGLGATYSIYNALGAIVKEGILMEFSNSMDVENLNSGVYTIMFSKNIAAIRFIKN
jgi:hypothetical protein